MNSNKTLLDFDLDRFVNRRSLLLAGSAVSASLLAGGLLAGCGGSSDSIGSGNGGSSDQKILNAAATAEALATTMYYNIISTTGGIYKNQLAGNAADQAYLIAGYEEELNHYKFLLSAGASALATTFYFPTGMFTDAQTTVDTLVLLEDAFIAAYLIGVRDFSTSALKVIAAQTMGIEAEHRTLARVITNDLNLSAVKGLAGSEPVRPPSAAANNLAYERTFSSALPDIDHVVAALGPFVTKGTTGFSMTPFTFAAASAAPPAGQPIVTLQGTTPAG